MASDSAFHALAGSAGGVTAMSLTYPLIFLSTRAAVNITKNSKTTWETVKDILEREGIRGMYSGIGSSLLGISVTNGIYYYFYERSRGVILRSRQGPKGLSTLEAMLAGLIAGSATTVLSNPLWVIQTSQAVHTMEESEKSPTARARVPGILETIKDILSNHGLSAFWRGVGPALVLVLNPVLQYTIFEQLKNLLVRRRTAKLKAAGIAVAAVSLLSDWDYFYLGAVSKLVATSATYPYIVVKSRLQAGHEHALRYKSSFDGLLTILRQEGAEGLYKGLVNKLIQSVLTAAILFATQRRFYEIIKQASLPVVSK